MRWVAFYFLVYVVCLVGAVWIDTISEKPPDVISEKPPKNLVITEIMRCAAIHSSLGKGGKITQTDYVWWKRHCGSIEGLM